MLIKFISTATDTPEALLLHLAETANKRYKVYTIPKRDGNRREIAQPSHILKGFQRWVVAVLLNRMPLHRAATAYKKNSNIAKNASQHKSTHFTNHYDFADFFPSFTQETVILFLADSLPKLNIIPTQNDLSFISNLLCLNGRLTIGAPSSPALTNAMMYEFDEALYSYCQSRNLVYTRYADDIFVSAYEENKLNSVADQIKHILASIPYLEGLKLKPEKTAYLSKKYRRTITGLTITTDNNISIGRERKREIRALIHLWKENKLSGAAKQNLAYLKGLLTFAISIEPDLWERLSKKYGKQTMDRLKAASA